jgi:hypothetical protein
MGGKTFSCLFNTGASATCLTSTSFQAAFPDKKTKKVQNAQDCVAASGNKMYTLGIFKIDHQIKGKTFKHQINIIDQLNDNIIGIGFMHKHKLHYDMPSREVKIAGINTNQIIICRYIC